MRKTFFSSSLVTSLNLHLSRGNEQKRYLPFQASSLLSDLYHCYYTTIVATTRRTEKTTNTRTSRTPSQPPPTTTLLQNSSFDQRRYSLEPRKNIHYVASSSFNYNAELYNKVRPSYPPEALDFIMSKLREIRLQQKHQCEHENDTQTPCRVLDLASGSGLFTKCLLPFMKPNKNNEAVALHQQPQGLGSEEGGAPILSLIDELYAVEPAEGMRNEFKTSLPNYVPIMEGNSRKIPFPDNYFDMVTVAQAFHWFSNRESLMEIRRVLKKTPGNSSGNGGLILLWNLESRKSQLTSKLRDIYERYDSDVPQYRKGEWEKAFDTQRAKEKQQSLFDPLERKEFVHYMLVSQKEVWDRIVSKSYITILKTNNKKEEFLKCKTDIEKVIQEEQKEFCHKRASDEIGLDGVICYRQPIDCEVVFTKCV